MAQHKWHKEIKAWADGAEIEWRFFTADFGWTNWISIEKAPSGWDGRLSGKYKFNGDFSSFDDKFELRIKPQPKEPQYLYVYGNGYATLTSLEKSEHHSGLPLKAKIKLEVDDDTNPA